MSQRCFAVLTVATAVLVAACGGGGDTQPDPAETVTKTAGDQQAGLVGQLLEDPLSVRVTTDGAPDPGVTVNWSTTGGTLTPTSVPTDANGVASTSWTLGTTSGAQTATATVSGATGSPATFSATALAAAAAVLEEADGNGQTGEINTALAEPVQARVTDEFGNAVADVAVNWTATGAAVSAPTVPSDAAGISQVTVTLGGTPGPITITAASEGLDGSPVDFTATAVEPAPIPTTASVTVRDNNFLSVRNATTNPAVDTVAVGGSVTWTWAASTGASHNITPPAPPSSSFTGRETVTPPPLPAPHTATFAVAGTYIYYCSIHGSGASGMSGRIVVR
jgi:plastocyanin